MTVWLLTMILSDLLLAAPVVSVLNASTRMLAGEGVPASDLTPYLVFWLCLLLPGMVAVTVFLLLHLVARAAVHHARSLYYDVISVLMVRGWVFSEWNFGRREYVLRLRGVTLPVYGPSAPGRDFPDRDFTEPTEEEKDAAAVRQSWNALHKN